MKFLFLGQGWIGVVVGYACRLYRAKRSHSIHSHSLICLHWLASCSFLCCNARKKTSLPTKLFSHLLINWIVVVDSLVFCLGLLPCGLQPPLTHSISSLMNQQIRQANGRLMINWFHQFFACSTQKEKLIFLFSLRCATRQPTLRSSSGPNPKRRAGVVAG